MINYDNEKNTRRKKGDMRLNASKNKTNPHDFINNYLEKNKSGSLNKIFNSFVDAGFSYSKVAIHKILKKMEDDNILKNIAPENKHPVYSIIDTTEWKIKKDGYAFKDQICANVLSLSSGLDASAMFKEYSDMNKKIIIDLIIQFGMISFYTCLASHKRSPSKYGVEKNKKLRELWLRNAMSFENNLRMAKFSRMFDTKLMLKIMTEKNDDLSEEEYDTEDERVSAKQPTKEITPAELKKESSNLEKTFSKMFPDWHSEFQSSERVIDGSTYELLRNVCIKHPEYLLE